MLAELEEGLTSAGFRPTRQRRAVYNSLVELHNHPTAEEVFTAVRRELPHISLATVYKALESLAVAGLATKIGCCEGSTRFDARVDGHYHARCRCCGRVEDVDEHPAVAAAVRALDPPLAILERLRVEFVGVCAACQLRGANRTGAGVH